jgi:hypothetical protein
MTDQMPLPQTSFLQPREQAVALRRAGKSRREIKESLLIRSNRLLNDVLCGEPPLPSMWRPNATDDLREKARGLRNQGLDYKRIATELGVSKSSVSLWVRDIPRPAHLSYEECRKRQAEAVATYWAATSGDEAQFRRPSLKRHNPATNRSNLGDHYRGCLRIEVRCSVELSERIEGWAQAAMSVTSPAMRMIL